MATLFARSQSYQSSGPRNAALALMDGVTSSRDMAAPDIGPANCGCRMRMILPTIVSCQRRLPVRGTGLGAVDPCGERRSGAGSR